MDFLAEFWQSWEEEREGGGGGTGEEEEGRGKKSYLSCKVMGGSEVK